MSKHPKHSWRISLMAGLLAVLMLPMGCGQSGGSSSGSEPSEEVTTVRWITAGTPQTGMDAVLEEVNKLLAERYGLKLQLEIYDYGSYDEKMNMIISSGEEFDVCFTTQSWLNKYQPNVSRGAFLALDDLIDENAPGLREVLPEFLFEQARVDGAIYAVPNYQICYDSLGFMMRKDLVEKYNFDWENVKTVEDMYPFWDAIRDNEPDLYPVGDLSIQAFEDDFVAMCMIQDYYTVAGSGASSFYIKKGDDSYTVDWLWSKSTAPSLASCTTKGISAATLSPCRTTAPTSLRANMRPVWASSNPAEKWNRSSLPAATTMCRLH